MEVFAYGNKEDKDLSEAWEVPKSLGLSFYLGGGLFLFSFACLFAIFIYTKCILCTLFKPPRLAQVGRVGVVEFTGNSKFKSQQETHHLSKKQLCFSNAFRIIALLATEKKKWWDLKVGEKKNLIMM